MNAKKITPNQIANKVQFLKKLSSLVNLESFPEIIRDLAECQSLIDSHQLLINNSKDASSLMDTLHEIELLFRSLDQES